LSKSVALLNNSQCQNGFFGAASSRVIVEPSVPDDGSVNERQAKKDERGLFQEHAKVSSEHDFSAARGSAYKIIQLGEYSGREQTAPIRDTEQGTDVVSHNEKRQLSTQRIAISKQCKTSLLMAVPVVDY
jgi:hypothetical protein